jgi:hypothetical protein
MAFKKVDLGNTYESSYNTRGGNGGKGACDWSKYSGNIKFYKAKENANKLVIIPYEIKSKVHPLAHAGKRKIGDFAYNLDVWVHRNVGPGEVSVVCPSKNYGKACPLCEAADKAYKENDQDTAKALKASRRVYYNVVDMADPDEGLEVFDVSHYYFEKELIGSASRKGENGQMVRFADPDNKYGKIIKFYGEKEKVGTFESMKFKDFDFVERKIDVEGFIEKAVSFDELLTLHSYDEIMMIMNGTDEEDNGADSESDESDTNAKDTPQPTKAEEDEDAALEARRKAKAASKAEGTNPCPSGYKFGIEWGDHPECKKDTCPVYKQCGVAG